MIPTLSLQESAREALMVSLILTIVVVLFVLWLLGFALHVAGD